MVNLEEYDDVIEVQCDEVKDYLTFRGAQLDAVAKVRISCLCDTRNNRLPQPVHYEDMWYAKGNAVGCKRFVPLPIKECDQVAIFVRSKSLHMNDAELGALAGCLVRMRLELSLNRNLIVTVRVANDSLDGLICQLRRHNFSPYSEVAEVVDSLIPLQLETEFGKKEVMCFRGNR